MRRTSLIVVLMMSTQLLGGRESAAQEQLEVRLARLEAQIERIESVRAIKRLQYAYGHYVELGLWNDFADLFTDDATTNYQQGVRGREEVRALFLEQVGQGKLGLAQGRIYPHILFQPVVHLAPNGRAGKGRWRILAMLGGFGGSATWYSGVYENEYVHHEGVWKIAVLRSEPKASAAYSAAGWRDAGIEIEPHYDTADIARPLADLPVSTALGAGMAFDALAAQVDGLARRATVLAAEAEVANLLDVYGYAVDRKRWDEAASLFSADGTLEIGQQGVYVGPASIRRGLNGFGPPGLRDGERNDHVYLQTLITVAPDGRTAFARGVELIFSAGPGGASGELTEGTFENVFVRRDDVWAIQSVRFYPRMIVDAAMGWAESAKPAPGPSDAFPPDRPPTSNYEIYPAFAVAPFHFDNPVTGKPPQYPDGVIDGQSRSSTVSPNAAPIRDRAELAALLTKAERDAADAEAYDAIENLVGAFGYARDGAALDDGRTSYVSQVLQPVIEIAGDGSTADVRARLLELQGTADGPGTWAAGAYAGTAVRDGGVWTLPRFELERTWSGPYPGGWAR